MTGTSLLTIDRILPDLKVSNQKQAFRLITGQAALDTALDQKWLMNRLLTREGRSVCSGIGDGVAIPQLTTQKLNRPYTLFARLSHMIDYNAVDSAPVDLIFLLLSPKADGPYHLQRLARISRLLRDRNLCQSLRSARSTDTINALLAGPASSLIAA